MPRAFCININDNVATLLDEVTTAETVRILGHSNFPEVVSRDAIKLGHKIALRDLKPDESIMKFGVPIGRASSAISAGQWVHLHNCRSGFDERSQTLDLHTGAATDTRYE